MSKAKPEAGEDTRTVVLPELLEGKGSPGLFLHGWHNVPGGVKPTYHATHGHEVINPKLPDDDMEEAVRIAQRRVR